MSFWHKVRQREKQRLGGRAGWLGRHHGGVRREGDGTRGPGQGRSSPGTPVRWAGLASVEGRSLCRALTSQDPAGRALGQGEAFTWPAGGANTFPF